MAIQLFRYTYSLQNLPACTGQPRQGLYGAGAHPQHSRLRSEWEESLTGAAQRINIGPKSQETVDVATT
jgi:hypothetical protein